MDYRDENAAVFLRPMTAWDTEQIVRWRNQENVKKYFLYRGEFTNETHLNWIEKKVKTGEVVQFIICDINDSAPLGSVYVRDIDRVNKKGEYGIFIGEEKARNRGVGTAACLLMCKYCFEELDLHRIYLRVLEDNIRAQKSYEKAGFVREGVLKDDVFLDGSYRNIVWMAKVRK
ncbi:MAG: UDP-4-amino-4,6-dideoxy-N-acetyl-beta-L-altrosamine N-acetyltransferase [Lachnospiraceae bacterium]|nr:UDP-4-amino-4,6-dideoxy-N-acetyl-beta-L-altrosamine N-acetyltransferase [Lachnospiraceae bacterium]